MNIVELPFTTAANGTATVTYPLPSKPMFLVRVDWVDGDVADGVGAVLKAINTATGIDQTLLTLTNANNDATYYPREAEHDNTGASGSGTTFPVFAGDLQLTVTSGGDTKSGSCFVWFS